MIGYYERKIRYYETDKMGITHHSNYVRLMEEARTDYLEENGCSYAEMEKQGMISPVISFHVNYKNPTTFNDIIIIRTALVFYDGVKSKYEYVITDKESGKLIVTGYSEHCCVNQNGRPVIMKRAFPEFNEKFIKLLESQSIIGQ